MNESSNDLYGSDNWSFKRINHLGTRGNDTSAIIDISRSNDASPRPPSTSKRSASASMKHKVPVLSTGRQYNISRPPLLVELEQFIATQMDELKRENVEEPETDDWLSMRRLTIYKDAFQRFIEEFNIYKPILTAIKYEYESAFDYFSSKARKEMSTKTEFVTHEREHSQKMAQKDQQHAAIVEALEIKNALVEKKLAEKTKELQITNAQVDILKMATSKAEAVADDVKRSCITLTNALKRNEAEKKELVDIESGRVSEILSLKIAFHKSSNELERLRLQVHDMESNQSTLVSHEKLERHVAKIQDLREQLEEKDEEHRALIQRYSLLKNAIEVSCQDNKTQLALKRGSSFSNMSKFDWTDKNVFKKVEEELTSRSSDPRYVIESLISQVVNLTKQLEERSAGQLQDGGGALEINDGNDGEIVSSAYRYGNEDSMESPWLHFQGLGIGPNIPLFLRVNGNVCNLNFSKMECEMHVNDIWAAKLEYDEALHLKTAPSGEEDEEDEEEAAGRGTSRESRTHLADFFRIFLERHFKTTSKSIEFAYNFLSALKKYEFDSDCALFLMIMNKDLPEDIRTDQLELLALLLEECQREEMQTRGQCEGHLPLNSFIRVIKRVIPTKGAFAFRRLEKALHLECKGRKHVLYRELLQEDENGNQGRFCETLRMQHVTECTTFANHVLDVIDTYAKDEDALQAFIVAGAKEKEGGGDGPPARRLSRHDADATTVSSGDPATHLPIGRFREALVYADPDNSRAGLNKLLARGCAMTIEEMLVIEINNLSFPVAQFKENLKTGMIKKSFPSSSTAGGGERGGNKMYG